MKITFRTSLLVVAFNIVLAFCIIIPISDKAGWTVLWSVPVIVMAIAALLCVATLFVVAIVQRPRLEPKIYFFGQLLGTIAIIGYPSYMAGHSFAWNGNVQKNRTFAGKDSATMIAFHDLEAKFSNKKALDLESIFTYQEDTTKATVLIFLLYNTPRHRDEYLTSKHVVDSTGNRMIYYDVPYSENTELQRLESTTHPPN